MKKSRLIMLVAALVSPLSAATVAIQGFNSPIYGGLATNANISSEHEYGWEFAVNGSLPITVTALGVYDPPSVPISTNATVGLWDSSGHLLASAIIPPNGSPIDNFLFVPITSITLLAGSYYQVGEIFPSNTTSPDQVLTLNPAYPITPSEILYAGGSNSDVSSLTGKLISGQIQPGGSAAFFGGNFQFQVGQTSGFLYVPASPCRVVDTRKPTGPFGGPFLAANGSRSFPIPNSTDCPIPSTAQAYSLNLTVVPHGTLGYVTMWPTGQTQPVVSTLNSLDGRVKANAAIVPAGSGGAVSVYATDDTDVVMDINGYFVAPSVSNAESFYPTTPCRLVDTRAGAPSTVSVGALIGGTSRTLPLLSSSCNVPGAATAYSLNFTVVPSNGTLGYLTVYPTGLAQPLVSTMNAPTGTVVANAAIIPSGTAGSIDVYATDTTDLIVDIDGYFAPPVVGGLSFYPLAPCRVLDSRNPPGTPPFINLINVDVISSGCSSATTAQSYVFNATVVPSGGSLGYLTLYPE